MTYEVNIVIAASPSKYLALLAFADRGGKLHEKQIQADRKATKNSNTIQAAIDALRELAVPCRVNIYSDSEYLVEPVRQGWVKNWEENGWETARGKPVRNAEQWQQLRELMKEHETNIYYNREREAR